MLAKCTNPLCSASFRHVAEGQLFRLETGQPAGSSKAKVTEYFWLCERCSARMTLHLAHDGRVMPTGLREPIRDGPRRFVDASFAEAMRLSHLCAVFSYGWAPLGVQS
jgi:hypothetical protein